MPRQPGRPTRPFALLLLTLALGCADGRSSLQGKVTLDGTPVQTGMVSLVPIEGNPGPGGRTQIVKGGYSFAGSGRTAAGTYQVEISYRRKTGRQVPAGSPAPAGTMVDEEAEEKSTLRATLKPGGNTQDFALTSKKD